MESWAMHQERSLYSGFCFWFCSSSPSPSSHWLQADALLLCLRFLAQWWGLAPFPLFAAGFRALWGTMTWLPNSFFTPSFPISLEASNLPLSYFPHIKEALASEMDHLPQSYRSLQPLTNITVFSILNLMTPMSFSCFHSPKSSL